MSDPNDPGSLPPGYQAPWSYPPPLDEPGDQEDGQQASPEPPRAPWPPLPSWEPLGDQPTHPPERPSRVSRPYLDPPGADRQPSGPFQAPDLGPGPGQYPLPGQPPQPPPPTSGRPGPGQGGPVERPERPSRLSRPLAAPQPDQPGQPGQPLWPDPHPSGPFDASGAPIRPYGPPSGPQARLQPPSQAGQGPYAAPFDAPFETTGPQPAQPAPPAPETPEPPGSEPGRAFRRSGAASADKHPSGPFDRSGAPAPNGRAGQTGEHQVQPAGRTGRQARLKGGDQRDQKGGGRRRSGPLLSRPANRPKPSRPSGGGSALSGRRSNLVMAAVLLAVAVVAAVLVSRLPGDQQTNEAAAAAPIGAPYSSRWICPVVPDANGSITVANSGKEPAQVRATLSTADPDDATKPATSRALPTGEPLAAGASRAVAVGAKEPGLLQVESFGAPVTVGAAGQPACATSAAERWWLTAADTSQGKVDVVLANPGSEGAVVQMVLHTSTIPYRPGALKRVFVPAHSAVRKNLNGFAELDMSVEVVALLGRVVAGAVTKAPGAKESTVIPGQPGAQAVWSFAGGRGGKGDDTRLALANPSLDPLVVDVRVVTAKDAITPPGFEDLEVPSGATVRVAIDVNNAPGGAMGVEVRSRTGAPFTAALVVRPRPGSGNPYIDSGTPQLWKRWFLPRAGGKRSVIMANLGDATISATIADLGRPDEPAIPVKIGAGRVVVKEINGAKGAVVVDGDKPGLVVTLAGGDSAIPSVMVDGTPLSGPVQEGPAAG